MTTNNSQNNKYWKMRQKQEQAYQAKALQDVNKFNDHIKGMYEDAVSAINQEIYQYLGIQSDVQYKRIKQADFDRLARKLAKEVNNLKQSVTGSKSQLKKALNDRLKLYRASMRIGRAEILKSAIGAHLAEMGVAQATNISDELQKAYNQEKSRQAGILGGTTKTNLFLKPVNLKQLSAQVNGANYSDRIWANVDALKGVLDSKIATGLIRGDNPREVAKDLTDQVDKQIDNARYATERLARTETARAQTQAAINEFKQRDVSYVKLIAELDACQTCEDLGKDNPTGLGEGIYEVDDAPEIPAHPNCRCSLAAYHP